jgi:hypothetical protein
VETKPEAYSLFKHFKITQPECSWIKKEDIDAMIQRWGAKHPLVLSSVYADFAEENENAIISLSSITNCINSPTLSLPGSRQVALDFAAGGDANCIAYACGNEVKIIKVWHEKDTMTAAGQFVAELNKLKESIGLRPNEVFGDASGLGLPIIHRMAELGWKINLFYGQAKPNDENYKNRITECWLDLARKITNKSLIIPDNQELIAQLTSRKQRLNSSGKMELESKEDMKSRGLPSPDVADAVAMAVSKMSTGEVTFMKAMDFGRGTNMSSNQHNIGAWC